MRAALVCIFLLIPQGLSAANHYVRAGAAGTGTGADWTNACAAFSGSCAIASLVRGDTYYVGNGTVVSGATTWNKAASGTTLITVQKATIADHGTATGWSDSYAAQATFVDRQTFSTAYWTFNGVVGDFDTAGIGSYGFKFDYSEGGAGALFSSGGNHVTLQYIDCDGVPQTGDYNYSGQAKCIEAYGGSDWDVSHVAMHGCESCVQGGATNGTLEYCYIYNSRSISTNFHNNVFFIDGGSSNITVRYNKVWDFNAEGFFLTFGFPATALDHVYIYGNVMSGTGTESEFPRGVEIRQNDVDSTNYYSDIHIYNNTFAHLDTGISDRSAENGRSCLGVCEEKNNLSYLAANSFGASNFVKSNNTDDSTNRFVNVATRNFHLTGALAGTSLVSPYNVDMDGNTRGADGVFDVGAFEFGVATPSITPASFPTGTVTQVYSQTLTASNFSGTVTWSRTAGTLAPGLSDCTGTGATKVLSGTLTTAGSYSWTCHGTDGTNTADDAITMTVNAAPSITTSSPLPEGAVGVAYSQTLTASPAGTTPDTWSVSAGTVPTGTSLSSSGVLSGTPSTISGSPFSFTARVSDSNSIVNTKAFSVTIGTVPTITTTSPLTAGTVGSAYSAQFAATGDTPITWTATGVPGGLGLSSSGLLSGTPNAAATSTIQVTATNAAGTQSSAPTAFSITISTGLTAPHDTFSGTQIIRGTQVIK